MTPRSIVPALLLAATACGTAAANPSCPLNHLMAGVSVDSSLPVDHRSSSVCDPYGCADVSVSYSIPAAQLSASSGSSGAMGTGGSVLVQDDFTLIGPAAGTPATLTVHMAVGRSGYLAAYLRDGLGTETSTSGDGTDNSPVDLTLDVAALAGQPFRLQFELVVYNYYVGDGSVFAHFSFTGIPPGAAVVSCNGYASGQVVPARATSWGRLKSLYR